MTPKEKAKELVDKFMKLPVYYFANEEFLTEETLAKQCALIAVNEIIDCWEEDDISTINFWQQVKQEIEML